MKTPLLLLASAMALTAGAAFSAETPSWTCGGVGADARRAWSSQPPQAGLELVFVTERRGGYLAGVEWSIRAGNGAPVIASATAEGPLCRVRLVPGAYRVDARHAGAARSTRVTVPASGRARSVLAFPEEPWDGIRASEDEKRQAREP